MESAPNPDLAGALESASRRVPRLSTERLVLREWRLADVEEFAALNADPVVMEHLMGPRSTEESVRAVSTYAQHWADTGWGLWAVEVAADHAFIGYTGLWPADVVAPGAVEVGWRLARAHWGHGYASEAAVAALGFGFETLGLGEVVSFAPDVNVRSLAVMRRIGLEHDPARDFDHPRVDPGRHPQLVHHRLHAMSQEQWRARLVRS